MAESSSSSDSFTTESSSYHERTGFDRGKFIRRSCSASSCGSPTSSDSLPCDKNAVNRDDTDIDYKSLLGNIAANYNFDYIESKSQNQNIQDLLIVDTKNEDSNNIFNNRSDDEAKNNPLDEKYLKLLKKKCVFFDNNNNNNKKKDSNSDEQLLEQSNLLFEMGLFAQCIKNARELSKGGDLRRHLQSLCITNPNVFSYKNDTGALVFELADNGSSECDRQCTYYSFEKENNDEDGIPPSNRQVLYVCLDCNSSNLNSKGFAENNYVGGALCHSCSVKCHAGHDLHELYSKRYFKCDCGTDMYPGSECLFDTQLGASKPKYHAGNKYNDNFRMVYCVCKQPFYEDTPDPVEMIQCIVCEDWYHIDHIDCQVPEQLLSRIKGVGEFENQVFDELSEFLCYTCAERFPYLNCYRNLEYGGGKNLERVSICPHKMYEKEGKTRPSSSIFFRSGWREQLCRCEKCMEMYRKLNHLFFFDKKDMVSYCSAQNRKNSALAVANATNTNMNNVEVGSCELNRSNTGSDKILLQMSKEVQNEQDEFLFDTEDLETQGPSPQQNTSKETEELIDNEYEEVSRLLRTYIKDSVEKGVNVDSIKMMEMLDEVRKKRKRRRGGKD